MYGAHNHDPTPDAGPRVTQATKWGEGLRDAIVAGLDFMLLPLGHGATMSCRVALVVTGRAVIVTTGRLERRHGYQP